MAQILEVHRSLVYRTPAVRKDEKDELSAIERIVVTFLGYGYRRVFRSLRAQGLIIGETRTRRLMRENGLMAWRPRSKEVTRDSLRERRSANLLKGLKAERPDQVWAADTTLVRTSSGTVYLAALLDVYSRKVVAWHMSRRNDEALVRTCLDKALEARRLPLGWIYHSDLGSTYTTQGSVRKTHPRCRRQSQLLSSWPPQENAFVERFFRTVKLEEVDRNRYETFLEANASIDTYMKQIYDPIRMNSSLSYLSPDHFEARQSS